MTKKKIMIILLIIAVILCLGIGSYAVNSYLASDIQYTKSDGTKVSVQEALDELHTIQPLAKAVSIGDYVAYEPEENYYRSEKGSGTSNGNGYGTQEFTTSNSVKWRVLGWNDKTGGVMLISERPIQTDNGTNFYMKGAVGYLYAEHELNQICSIYGKRCRCRG